MNELPTYVGPVINLGSKQGKILATFCLLLLAGCAGSLPPARSTVETPSASQAFAPPDCGSRVFVVLGLNQKYAATPQYKNLHPKHAELYVDGMLVDTLTSNPEVSIIDAPAGKIELSWMDPDIDSIARAKTKQNSRILTLGNRETAFVVLDWFDETNETFGLLSILATMAFHTEVVETRDMTRFAGRRVVFHRPLPIGTCSIGTIAGQTPPPPASQLVNATSSTDRTIYVVAAPSGAPAFVAASAIGTPIYTFPDGSKLNVVEITSDKLWLKVLIPDGRTAYVPDSIVRSSHE